MDGFAFNGDDIGKKLIIKGVIFAGDTNTYTISKNEAYKIMTGAKVPNGADTIIPIENVNSFDKDYVDLPDNIKRGSHYRNKGEDYLLDSLIFKKGQKINATTVSLLSTQGISVVDVYVLPSIAVLSTGNELREPWENASEDEIYNSNSSGIIAILKEHNFNASYIGVVPDNLEDTILFFNSLKSYDVIISTGGISVGDADFVGEAFLKNGLEIIFHGVNVKPGRPTMMGKMGKTFVMAMPGNPLTALINTSLLSIPIISKISGGIECYHNFVYAKNTTSFRVKKGRANIVLGSLKNGEWTAFNKNKYGSGMFSPVTNSNSVVITLGDVEEITKEQMIKVVPFDFRLLENQSNIFNEKK
jgi:molybdopterin molybdotransferase